MAKANVASELQTIIEVFSRQPARRVVEIDQHVPAKDDVEVAELHHVGGIDEVGAGELDRLAKPEINLKPVGIDRLEITLDDVLAEPHQRTVAVDAIGGILERPGIDVR